MSLFEDCDIAIRAGVGKLLRLAKGTELLIQQRTVCVHMHKYAPAYSTNACTWQPSACNTGRFAHSAYRPADQSTS